MAHVFIVNEKSFKIHLEYKFAATGNNDGNLYCIGENTNKWHWIKEKVLVGMIADVSRIRKGDKILFYLQSVKEREGMFFGSFVATEKAFLCRTKYLEKELGKQLSFRIPIEADEVYPIGLTERECLDNIDGIEKPYEMCWSLIYRKLKGNRGCTMITDSEYDLIMDRIKRKNKNVFLTGNNLSYDQNNATIKNTNKKYVYDGIKESLDVFEYLKAKAKNGNAFETHLQAYIMQNLERIPLLLKNNTPITWIGNEMSCGVGMQSIDVVFVQENEKNVDIFVCELKDEQPEPYIKDQIGKYVDWMRQYIVPTFKNKMVTINPIIIAPTPKEITIQKLKMNDRENLHYENVANIRYISFDIKDNDIEFKEVNYE